MADVYRIQGETLTDIADAIRAKTGGSSAMTPAEMVTAIGTISGGGGSWTHQQYTLAEDWTTTAAGGNTNNFYNTYLSGTVGKVVIVLITNNSVTGNGKATSVVGINDTSYTPNSGRSLFFSRSNGTNALIATYDFFMSAGSVIDIYISDMPNGGA